MPATPDSFADLERRAWRSTFDDGLFDLLLGGMLLLLGVAAAAPNDRLLYPFYFALIAVFWVVKWRVVLPRGGVVRFARARRQRKVLAGAVLLAATILSSAVTAILAAGGEAGNWLQSHPVVFDVGFPLLMVVVFSALAVLLDVTRIHAIGVVFALSFGVERWFDLRAGFLAGGTLITLTGLVLFVRFVRTHPRRDAAVRGGLGVSTDPGARPGAEPDAAVNVPFDTLRDLDRLVHEPARLMVLAYLFVTESADFVFLANQTGLTLGNLSSHVAKLEEAGYVEIEKTFRGKRPNTQLRLTGPGRAAFAEYRERMERALRTVAHGDRTAS